MPDRLSHRPTAARLKRLHRRHRTVTVRDDEDTFSKLRQAEVGELMDARYDVITEFDKACFQAGKVMAVLAR